jgi:hypothetical protein
MLVNLSALVLKHYEKVMKQILAIASRPEYHLPRKSA